MSDPITRMLDAGGLWSLVGLALLVYWVSVIIVLVAQDREPSTTLAWLLVLFALPLIGLILYFFVGRDWALITRKRQWYHDLVGIQQRFMDRICDRYGEQRERLRERVKGSVESEVISAIEKQNGAEPLPARTFDVYPSGGEYFPVLIEDISRAQRFVHMQYFIWERDELTTKITDALMDRVKAGVEVRILNDYLGNIQYKKDQLKALKAAGAHIGSDVTQIGKLNYRNHRKITVIDGELGHSGGVNIGQEYIDGGEKYPTWRDTGIRFTGPAVAELQKLFAMRWYEVYKESLYDDRYFPDPASEPGGIMLQVVAQGVEDYWNSATRAHQIAISGAEEKVLIQSPYFIPDLGTMDALVGAALAGKEVHFMMTGWPDKKIAFRAAQTYWAPLLRAGGHIYLYMAGFFHAKALTVDSKASAIGTMNMDIRSLKLHKELMVWNYDPECAKRCEEIFAADLEKCREVMLEEIEAYGPTHRFLNSGARLASNLM